MNNRGIMSNAEWRSPLGRFIRFFYLIILLIVSILVIFPFIFSFTAGLHNSIDVVKPGIHLWPKTPLWGNYLDAWQRFKISRLFLNTAIAAGGGVFAQLVVSSLAAYSLSRLNPIGKNVIRAIILITMAVPGIVYLVPRYVVIAKMGLIDNFLGLWIPYAASSFMILVLNNAFDQIPRDLYEAAQIDGARHWQIFIGIYLPMNWGITIALGIIVFIGAWNAFLWPFLAVTKPELMNVTVGATESWNGEVSELITAVMVALPVAVLYLLFMLPR